MPLLGRKVFQLAKPLTLINPDETVYIIKHTGECFQSREEYDKRSKLYKEKIWTCQCTGHINLTHEEAWKSEQDAYQMLKKTFPECMEKPVLEIVHHSTMSLEQLIDQAYIRVNSMFFLGDQVQFKVKHGGRIIRGRIAKIDSPQTETSCHSPCSDKENSEQTSTNNSESSPRKYPPKLLPYNYNVRLLDEDKIISSVPAEDLIRCERPPNKDLLRLFIRGHALRSGTSANSPWIVDSKIVKKYSLPSKFADFLLSFPKLSEDMKNNVAKKRKLMETTSFLPKKKLKVELKLVNSETGLDNYFKTVNNVSSGGKKENLTANSLLSVKEKISMKKDDSTCENVLTVKSNDSEMFTSLDHSYSSPVKKQNEVRNNGRSPKTVSSSEKIRNCQLLKNQKAKMISGKQTPKMKNKIKTEQNEQKSSSSHSINVKIEKKVQEKKKNNQPSPRKQKLKQITLFDLSAKKNKKASEKNLVNKSPVKKLVKEISQSSTTSLTKCKNISPANIGLLIKKIEHMLKQKNKQYLYQYVDRLIKNTNPQQYSDLPDDVRILVLRRIAWLEEKTKLSKMSEMEKKAYAKQKKMLMRNKTMEKKMKMEDKMLNLDPLPEAKLVPTPDGVPNELFGDAVMIVEFLNCYSGLLMPGEAYPVRSDLLLKAVASGKEGFGYLARIILILLQTLLQDQIAEDYKELGVRLSDLPVNIYTTSELIRLCLRKHDDIGNSSAIEDQEENEDVPEEILSLLETAEIYELLPEEKLKILSGLCHRIMNSYSVQDYMEQKQKMTNNIWKQRKEQIKKELDEKRAAENKNQAENEEGSNAKDTKDDANRMNGNSNSNNSETAEEEKEDSIENNDDADDLRTVLKRRKKAVEEKQRKLQEERERQLREMEELKKQKQKETFNKQYEDTLLISKLTLRQNYLGFDRNHTRYWLFCEGTPGLYLEKGWVGENIEYRVDGYKEEICEAYDDSQPSSAEEGATELSIPTSGQNLWFHYDSMQKVDLLIKSLSRNGIRESRLRNKILLLYDKINYSMNLKKASRLVLKPSDGDKEILEAFKKELTETEVRVRKGVLGGVPNFDQWMNRLQKATSIRMLAPCLLETQANVLPRFLQGIMTVKKSLMEYSNENKEEVPHSEVQNSLQLQHWLDSVEMCATMSRLHVLLGVLDACIKWEKSSANAKCKICRKKDEDMILILCDNCNQAFHVYCLRPALAEVPDGDWICPACQPLSSRQNNRVETLHRRHQEEVKSPPSQRSMRSRRQDNDRAEMNSQEIYDSDASEDEDEDYEESGSDDETRMEECCLCGGDEDVIHCKKCRLGYHTFCHQPPMHNKPRGHWVCSYCQTGKKNKVIEKMRKKWQPWKVHSSKNGKIKCRTEKGTDEKSQTSKMNPTLQMTTRYRNKLQTPQQKSINSQETSREMRALRRAAERQD